MSRLSSMARFEGIGAEPRVIARCSGPNCNSPIYTGEEYLKHDDEDFCSVSCMVDSLDYDWIGGED